MTPFDFEQNLQWLRALSLTPFGSYVSEEYPKEHDEWGATEENFGHSSPLKAIECKCMIEETNTAKVFVRCDDIKFLYYRPNYQPHGAEPMLISTRGGVRKLMGKVPENSYYGIKKLSITFPLYRMLTESSIFAVRWSAMIIPYLSCSNHLKLGDSTVTWGGSKCKY